MALVPPTDDMDTRASWLLTLGTDSCFDRGLLDTISALLNDFFIFKGLSLAACLVVDELCVRESDECIRRGVGRRIGSICICFLAFSVSAPSIVGGVEESHDQSQERWSTGAIGVVAKPRGGGIVPGVCDFGVQS